MGNADLLESLLDHLFNGIFILDSEAVVTVWNPAAQQITGHKADLVIGKEYRNSPIYHLGEDDLDPAGQEHLVLQTLKDGKPREGRAFFKHAVGYRLPVAIRTFPVLDPDGKVQGATEVFSDNKAIISALQNLHKSEATVLFDPLTGIGNRPHIEVKIRSALNAFLAGGLPFGVLFMDIDHFKDFNDTYGHLTGDKVLRFVANSIRHNLRGSDSCGRWGGEEFIAVLMDIDSEGLHRVAEKLRQVIAYAEVEDDGGGLNVTISIGATLARPDDTLQTLIHRVDQLMYQSKQNGRDRVTVD